MKVKPFGCIPILVVIVLLLWVPLIDVSIPSMLLTLLQDGLQEMLRSVIVWLTDLSGSGADHQSMQPLFNTLKDWLWQKISEEERQVIQRFLEIRNDADALGKGA